MSRRYHYNIIFAAATQATSGDVRNFATIALISPMHEGASPRRGKELVSRMSTQVLTLSGTEGVLSTRDTTGYCRCGRRQDLGFGSILR